MTANRDLERRLLDHYSRQPLLRAPDWVLESALATITSTRRRGLLAPWRFNTMPIYAKAAAAVAAIVVVAIVMWQLAPSELVPGTSPGSSSFPSVSGAPTASPIGSPAPSAAPAASAFVPPVLSKRFTSVIHGYQIGYPGAWTVRPATSPWTTVTDPTFFDPMGDLFIDPSRNGDLFLAVASQRLTMTFDAWVAAQLVGECTTSKDVYMAGAYGVLLTGCSLVYLPYRGRVYIIRLYRSNDNPDFRGFDADGWLERIAETIQLRPADAIDIVPTPSP